MITKVVAACLISTFIFPNFAMAQGQSAGSNSFQQSSQSSDTSSIAPVAPQMSPSVPAYPSLDFGVDVKTTDAPAPQPLPPRTKDRSIDLGDSSGIQPVPGKSTEVTPEGGVGPATDDTGTTKIVDTAAQSVKWLPQTDLSTGALDYTYELTLPPGRNGMTPSLGFSYNSNRQNNDSFVGYGWEVTIPSISRVNRHGSDQLYNYNDFTSSLSGDLVKVGTTTSYVPKVDSGDFLTYSFINNAWIAYDKQGTRYFFGTTADSRQDDSASTTRVYKWMLEEVRDTNGNFIQYEYYKNAGQIYPNTVTYTGNGATDGIFEVVFNRESFAMSPAMYFADFAVRSAHRISDVEVMENGQWVRKYELGYATSTAHKLLSSITESGRDLATNAVVTKEPMAFTYKIPGEMTWTAAPGGLWELPHWFVRSQTPSLIQIKDVNGDAYPDVVLNKEADPSTCPDTKATWINDTHGGWDRHCANWIAPFYLANDGDFRFYDNGIRLFDYNGDQLTDMVYAYTGNASGNPIDGDAYINTLNPTNGETWVFSHYPKMPGFIFGSSVHANNATEIVDVNGDGLSDIVYGWRDDDDNQYPLFEETYIGNGTSWATTTSHWNLPWALVDENPYGPEVFTFAQFADINSDGLSDFLFRHEDNDIDPILALNNGHDWQNEPIQYVPEFTQEGDHLTSGRTDAGTRTFDVNGDGVVDFVNARGGSGGSTIDSVYLGTITPDDIYGIYFKEVYNFSLPYVFASSGGTSQEVAIVDIDADGMSDFLTAYRPQGGSLTASTTLSNGHPFTDMLVGIQTPEGASTTIEYKMSTKYFDENDDLLNPKLPIAVKTVASITTDDGLGNEATEEYVYADGTYYFASSTDRKFAGFGRVEKTDTVGNVTKTYFHQGNATATSTGEYSDHISKMGRPYRVEQYDANENLYAKTINRWERADLGNGASFVKLASTIDFVYDGDSDHKEKATRFFYDDTSGNLTQKTEYGEVTGSNDGTYVDTGSDTFVTTIAYASSTSSAHPIYLPSQETTVDQNSAKVREKKSYYDTLSYGNLNKGNPTKQEMWVSGSTYIDTEKTYDSLGLVTEEKDPRDKTTTYSYDAYNLYPATTTNPLSQKNVFKYDYSAGKPNHVTDPNGYVFETVFDGLDRVIEEKQPDLSSPSTLVTKAVYEYDDSGDLPRMVHSANYLNAATSTDSYLYIDGFGRVIQRRIEAEDSNTFVVTDTKYDDAGRVDKESLPYFSSGASSTAATTNNDLYVEYEYDALGRVTAVQNVLGQTLSAHDDWKLTVTDPNGEVKHLYKDAYENLVRVDEINSGSTYTTTYEYDGNKNLIKMTDALGNIRNFTYDGVGRRVSATDLHATADSTFGTWYYAYDAAGNLASSTDPKSQNVTYTYDDVNRPTAENYLGSAGTEVMYSYDTCVGGVGRMGVATSTGAIISYEYNPFGAVKKETKKIAGGTYATSYVYDRLGNLLRVTNPDGSEVSYEYNTAGQAEKVLWKEQNSTARVAKVLDLDYAPTGLVSYKSFDNCVESTYTYDSEKLYRLVNILTEKREACSGLPKGSQGPDIGSTNKKSQPISDLFSIETVLEGKTAQEKAVVKGTKISQVAFNAPVKRKKYTIEVTDMQPTDRGVIVFARVWQGKEQIGFGRDGSVDIERFIFINPPILVPDPQGDIERLAVNNITGEKIVYRYREDAREALLQALEHTLAVKQLTFSSNNIVAGKVGNTTSIIYPDAHPETSTVDGYAAFDGSASSWSTIQSATTSDYANDSDNQGNGVYTGKRTTPQTARWLYRAFFLFDTSSVGNDYIDSATFSQNPYATVSGSNGNTYISLVSASPASSTALTPADYDQVGSTKLATDVNTSAVVVDSYNNWILNETGIATINANGVTKFALRHGNDIANTDPSSDTDNGINGIRWADTTGTTQDPALVVEHSFADITTDIQNINYTYDAVGNITQIADRSNNSAKKIISYSYDDLHRLVAASTTAASSSPFRHTYSYSAVGNMTGMATSSQTGTTTYTYAGDSGSNYANPHAATAIGAAGLTYDRNGNTLTFGPQSNTWDYRNYITQTGNGIATSTATYDHTGERVRYIDNYATTTTYVSKFYQTDGNLITRYLYAGDNLALTIEAYPNQSVGGIQGVPGGDEQNLGGMNLYVYTPHYVHGDHLGGSNVITDESGTLEETLDYYPYGKIRIDETVSGFKSDHKFIGEIYDESSSLSYLNSRYLDGSRGQFLSQDPVFWEINQTEDGKKILFNPQLQNSYSYGANNPITNKDPQGRIIDTAADLAFIAYDLFKIGQAFSQGESIKGHVGALGLDVAGAFIPGVTGLGMIARVGGKIDDIGKFGTRIVQKTDDFSKLGKYAGTNHGMKLNDAIKQFADHNVSLTEHALERIVVDRSSLGINPSNVIDTFKTGENFFDTKHQNFVRFKDGVRVSIDKSGTIRTVVKDNNFLSKTNRFKKVKN